MKKILNNIKLNALVLILILFSLYVIYFTNYTHSITKTEPKYLNNLSLGLNKTQANTAFTTTTQTTLSFENKKECDFREIWVDLNDFIYFKIKSAYFIKESSLIRIFYLSNPGFLFNLSAILKIHAYNFTYNHTFNQSDFFESFVYPKGVYKVTCLDLKFDLSKIENSFNVTNTKLDLYFYINDKFSTKTPIKVKQMLYKFKDANKNSSVLCSKCFFLASQKDYADFKWWMYLNKRIGYKKIFFCDNDMSYHKFKDLFKENTEFLDIQNFKCIPNYIGEYKKKFMESLVWLRYRGVFSYASTDIFNLMFTNECYLKYADKYKYITVVDNDETIIPRLLEFNTKEDNFKLVSELELNDFDKIDGFLNGFKCNRYKNESNDYLEAYVKELERLYNVKKSESFYFQQGYYLKNELMNYLLVSIEDRLNKTEPNRTEIEIQIAETNNSDPFYFEISGGDELRYAKNLCKLNRVYVQPYIEKNKSLFEKVSDNFKRFYGLITGNDNQFTWGKTVHKTTSLRNICVHTMCGRRDIRIDMNHGHLSHFRGSFRFKNSIKFSIRQLIFDLNYFNCYMKPILDKNSKFFKID